MGLRSFRVLFALAGVLAALVAGCSSMQGVTTEFERVEGPVIAVLRQFDQTLVLLDAADLDELARVRLPSQCLDVAADGRTIVTAQCGMHGERIGREVGFLELATGRIEYVTLPSVDPLNVCTTGDGWSLAVTGMIDAGGQHLARFSTVARHAEDLAVPPAVTCAAGTRQRVWVGVRPPDSGQDAVEHFLVYREHGTALRVPAALERTVALCGFDAAVVAVGEAGPDGFELVRYDHATGEVLARSRSREVTAGPAWAWSAGRYVAVADGPGADLFTLDSLVLYDAESLAFVGRIGGFNGVTAVCALDSGDLVICEGDGSVTLRDAETFREKRRAAIGDPRGDLVDVEFVR